MRFARVTTILQALDKPALKRLEDYLHSPYFKIADGAADLFGYLKTLSSNYKDEDVSEERIAKKISFLSNRNKQDIIGARLFKAIEHFLVLENLEQDKYNQMQHLLKAYKQLYLLKHFKRAWCEAMDLVNKDPEQDIDTFFYRHIFTEIAFNGFDARLNRTKKNDIMPVIKTLDAFYIQKGGRYISNTTE